MTREITSFEVLSVQDLYGQHPTLQIEISGKRRQLPCGMPCVEGDSIAVIPQDHVPHVWHRVSNPIEPHEALPAERRPVLVWLDNKYLPFCGYVRYLGNGLPYFVVYHGDVHFVGNVVAWCDCLPTSGPENVPTWKPSLMGRGHPARPFTPDTLNLGAGI